MNQSACIIVPIRNAQDVLKDRILNLIEVVVEMIDAFEIRIVDDASVDGTVDVAEKLAEDYPQVTVIQRTEQAGICEAAEFEIDRTQASFVVVHDIEQALSRQSLQVMWSMRGSINVQVPSRQRCSSRSAV